MHDGYAAVKEGEGATAGSACHAESRLVDAAKLRRPSSCTSSYCGTPVSITSRPISMRRVGKVN